MSNPTIRVGVPSRYDDWGARLRWRRVEVLVEENNVLNPMTHSIRATGTGGGMTACDRCFRWPDASSSDYPVGMPTSPDAPVTCMECVADGRERA